MTPQPGLGRPYHPTQFHQPPTPVQLERARRARRQLAAQRTRPYAVGMMGFVRRLRRVP